MKNAIIISVFIIARFFSLTAQVPNLHIEGDNPILTIEAPTNNPRIQFTDDFTSTTDDWVIIIDKNDSGQFKWRYNNSSIMTLSNTGKLGIGTTVPETMFHIKGGTDVTLAAGTGFFQLGSTNGFNMVMDNNEIQGREAGLASTLNLNLDGGEVHIGRPSFNANVKLRGTFQSTSLEGVGDRNVVANANGELRIRSYEIGDLAHGGIIFWVDESGEHGLVAALSDQTSNIRWYAGIVDPMYETRATGDGIYAGEMNTAVIIAAHVAIGDDGNNYAAQICLDATISDYGDWYLPSKAELDLMYFNLHLANPPLGNFTLFQYWSSTESTFAQALYRNFNDGTHGNWNKASTSPGVRAIRSF